MNITKMHVQKQVNNKLRNNNTSRRKSNGVFKSPNSVDVHLKAKFKKQMIDQEINSDGINY
jgi:hypothetical protein